MLVLVPILDLVSTAWPFKPGTLEWRWGFFGLLASVAVTPMLGVLLGSLAARRIGGARLLRGVSVAYLAAAAVLAICLTIFLLDVRRITPLQAAGMITDYRANAGISTAKYLLAMGALSWLALAGFRVAAVAEGVEDLGE